jgi:non-specific serine/threonine protein kinase
VPLGLYGEQQLRVPPLGLPDHDGPAADSEAVQLFVQRAQALAPGFDPRGEDLAAVAGICAAVDGLPLAIELPAARLPAIPPHLPHRCRIFGATNSWCPHLLRA